MRALVIAQQHFNSLLQKKSFSLASSKNNRNFVIVRVRKRIIKRKWKDLEEFFFYQGGPGPLSR